MGETIFRRFGRGVSAAWSSLSISMQVALTLMIPIAAIFIGYYGYSPGRTPFG